MTREVTFVRKTLLRSGLVAIGKANGDELATWESCALSPEARSSAFGSGSPTPHEAQRSVW
jgi:hypothetical protein